MRIDVVDLLIAYLVLGALYSFCLFLFSKIKNEVYDLPEWKRILTSVSGFLQYMIIGTLVWMPALAIYWLYQKPVQQDPHNYLVRLKQKLFL